MGAQLLVWMLSWPGMERACTVRVSWGIGGAGKLVEKKCFNLVWMDHGSIGKRLWNVDTIGIIIDKARMFNISTIAFPILSVQQVTALYFTWEMEGRMFRCQQKHLKSWTQNE